MQRNAEVGFFFTKQSII